MVKRLGDALDDAGLPFEGEDFFVASYDPPFRLRGRHTEVWLVAQEDGRRPTL